ncbi:Hypothetical_protein [Hexamita inflata]|uniref:Hypothetical_protein n=1 Tax=Hexamita inflata TaxID=28002 RepID=A0AA86NUR5_9EUKA|nr:Hypothetical protein HINF_LOCUS14577 [Hexamita inflata]
MTSDIIPGDLNIQNSLSNVYHLTILKRKDLLPQILHGTTFILQDIMQQCKIDAHKLSKKSVVMKIDIQNALMKPNWKPFYGMETQLAPMQTQLYICGIIASKTIQRLLLNLIQVCLSSLCFSYAIEPILKQLGRNTVQACMLTIQQQKTDRAQKRRQWTSLQVYSLNMDSLLTRRNISQWQTIGNAITFDGINRAVHMLIQALITIINV